MGGTVSLYDILKARKTGLSPDLYTKLRAQREMSESVITAEPPIYFKSDGTALIDYLINGNTTQSGTPTPESPIFPQGCGKLETVGEKAGQYKIPITSADTTTNIYLGEVETTRKVKKLIFDGTENWTKGNYPKPDSYQFYITKSIYFPDAASIITSGNSFCTHFTNRETAGGTAWGTNFNIYMLINDLPENATENDFKAYLAAQYAAGTPVVVWYPLASETTGIVNEPLMKIGDYADTVSKEQAGVQIPTLKGNNELNINTTVTPKITLKGKIKQLPDSNMNALLSIMEEM